MLALNLSGVFEFATLVPSSAAGWTARNQYANAALSGVLAVVIASPCTAPFMGAALGFALAQPALLTLLVFAALGARHGAAVRAADLVPGLAPGAAASPGAWMERLKQFLAFPLYATVAWLVWVLGAQVDNDAVVRLLVTLVVRRVRAVGVACLSRRRRAARSRVAALARARRRRASSRGRSSPAAPSAIAPAPVQAEGDVGRGDPWQPFYARPRQRACRGEQARVRRLHGRVVRDLPGQQDGWC